jgi:dipeptidyl aminopeptidase/acylaminoacyl peptidase
VLSILLAAALAAAPAPQSSPRPWKGSDAGAFSFIDDVQIAPSGDAALIDAGRPDLSTDEFASSYLAVDLASGASRAMPRDLSGPRWSPDGKTIAWARADDKTGSVAIVLTKPDGSGARTLTHAARSVVKFAWSHDGKTIAAIETPPHAAKAEGPRIHWMSAESDYRDTRPPKRDVYAIDVVTGTERALTHDTWSYGGPETDHDPSWSADDTRLAVVRQPSPLYGDFEHAQYVTIEIGKGTVTDAVGHPFFAYPATTAPAFAPSGNSLLYAHTWDGQLPSREDLYVDGRDVSASLDRDLWSCGAGTAQWQRDDVLFMLMDGVDIRLYRANPSNGRPQALTPPGGSVEAFSAAPTGRIAYVWATPTQNPELYVLDPTGAPRRITHLGNVAGLAIAPTHTIEWQAPDGRTIHGQLTTPLGAAAAQAPLVVEPHGGPQCADDSSLSIVAQYFATNGYAYFRPDPRGSDGYGDWSYKAVVGDWGDGPMKDDLAGIDAVLRGGVGNADRLYIEGGSYGGYLTSWSVTHDHRFKAAVAAVPVTNLGLEYALSESPNIVRRFFGAKPLTDPALLAKESPITFASNDTTPTLVQIGLLDTRAPYAQAIEFYKAVAENGTETRLMADSKAGHGPNDPRGLVLWLQATAAWFVQHGAPAISDAVMPK